MVTNRRKNILTHEEQMKGKAFGEVRHLATTKGGVLFCEEVCRFRPLVLLIRVT
jgi:hypothetical protein